MIDIQFTVKNPWSTRFDPLWSKWGNLPFKHKHWELQTLRTDEIVSVEVRYTRQSDHAGLDIWLALFSWALNIKFYDSRHWDYDHNTWEIYEK